MTDEQLFLDRFHEQLLAIGVHHDKLAECVDDIVAFAKTVDENSNVVTSGDSLFAIARGHGVEQKQKLLFLDRMHALAKAAENEAALPRVTAKTNPISWAAGALATLGPGGWAVVTLGAIAYGAYRYHVSQGGATMGDVFGPIFQKGV